MKTFFTLLVFILIYLFSCKKENPSITETNRIAKPYFSNSIIITSFSGKVAGIYYCKRIDDIVDYNDSITISVYNDDTKQTNYIKIPIVKKIERLDTIEVISTGDSTVKIDGINFYLDSQKTFYNNFDSQGFSYSGYFTNDSIYYNFWCICQSGFNISGKKYNPIIERKTK